MDPSYVHRHFWALWILTAGLVSVFAVAGCRSGVSGLHADTHQASAAHRTINGSIRAPEGAAAFDGRTVELVNLATRARHRVETDRSGAFTFRVEPGDYRLDVSLRAGETVLREPGILHITRSTGDIDAAFVIGTMGNERAPRRRTPVYRVDDGLGSPMA